MFKRLAVLILIVAASIATTWLVARRLPVASTGPAKLSELKAELERCRQQIDEQRQILRKHSLDGTSRSMDELFALLPAKYPQGDWRPANGDFEDAWFWSID